MGAKILLIGLDSLDPRTLAAMVEAGVMPAAAGLRRKSDEAVIENYPGMGAGAFWPSTATGVEPGVHGRCFRMQFDPATYRVRFRDDAADFSAEAFWRPLDRQGLKISVTDWPHAPFQPLANGVLLENWLTHDPTGETLSAPADFAKQIIDRYGVDPWGEGLFTCAPTTVEGWRDFMGIVRKRIRTKARYCVDQLGAADWDLFAVSYSDAHDVGHYAFHLSDPAHPDYDAALTAAAGDPIRTICEEFDAAIGAMLDAAGPDAQTIVFGGPGMTPLASANPMMDLIARRLESGGGTAAQATEWAQKRYRAALPMDLRKALSPVTRRLLRKPPARPELATRRFFAVPHTHNSGCIRINLKGREMWGVVEPGEYDALVDQITRDLMEIRNADTGEPVAENVVATRREYSGPLVDNFPDIFVIWRRSAPILRIESPKIGVIENESFLRTGDHTPFGFCWAQGGLLGGARTIRPHDVGSVVRRAGERLSAREPEIA